jgi:hypothetical protein
MEHKERFKNNVISLASYVVDINADAINRKICLVDNSVLSLASPLVEKLDSTVIIESFIKKSFSHWAKIKAHDEKYFVERAFDFFSIIPENVIVGMSSLLMGKDKKGNYYVSKEVRENVWKYMESFVKISLKYLAPEGKGIVPKEEYDKELENWEVKLS